MIFKKTISQIVDENYVYARALHFLGIDFFDKPESSLKEVCEELKLKREQVIKTFASFDTQTRISFTKLQKLPLKAVLGYLSHTHSIFIKNRLPYIVHLFSHWEGDKMISSLLPEFIEDFIKHIYEEEDKIFSYINWLIRTDKREEKNVFFGLNKHQSVSLQEELLHHKNEDNFSDIRSLTDEIRPNSLHEKVILNEIRSFDREMLYHAEIENSVLFPRAIALEQRVLDYIDFLSQAN